MTPPTDIVRKTFFWDRLRGAAQGILETGYMGLTLVIAIEVFDAPNHIKSLIAAATPMGLLLTPMALSLFAWLHRPANVTAGSLLLISGLGMGAAAIWSNLSAYLVLILFTYIIGTQSIPMMAHIYAENYPPNKRGSYLSVSLMFSVAFTLIFSYLFGHLLDLDSSYYRIVLGILCTASVVAAFSVFRIPSSPVSKKDSQNPLHNLSYAFTDMKFGFMLLGWSFVGLGNLMVMPIRFEYLLQPEHGIEASAQWVTFLTLGLPAICRFVSAKFWGRVFDTMDFMILRMIINAFQMMSILLFFATKNYWIIGTASALYGFSMGGGQLSWSLWVTKFAPRKRTAAYMSVHTFLTGIRGFVAPFLGFYLMTTYGTRTTSGIGGSMILFSILLIFLLYWTTRPKPSR